MVTCSQLHHDAPMYVHEPCALLDWQYATFKVSTLTSNGASKNTNSQRLFKPFLQEPILDEKEEAFCICKPVYTPAEKRLCTQQQVAESGNKK